MIALMKFHSPRFFQIMGFLGRVPFFLVAGLLLVFLKGNNVTSSVSIVYILAQGLFEVGPNFTTFMLPAEIFPTRHRAFAHGIAAGSGKLGASLFQIFFQFVRFYYKGQVYTSSAPGTIWFGFTALCFIPTMLAGAIVTYVLIPHTRERNADNMPLDKLELLGNDCSWGWLRPVFEVVGDYFSSKTGTTRSPATANGVDGPPQPSKGGPPTVLASHVPESA